MCFAQTDSNGYRESRNGVDLESRLQESRNGADLESRLHESRNVVDLEGSIDMERSNQHGRIQLIWKDIKISHGGVRETSRITLLFA